MSPHGTPRHARSLRRIVTCVLVVAIAVATASAPAPGATAPVTVTVTVPSSVVLDPSGCATGVAGKTVFGNVLPGQTAVTSLDCSITYGSSNDTASLKVYQRDQVGTAGGQLPGSWTTQSSGGMSNLNGTSAYDVNRIYVAGNWTIQSTTNGGTSWTNVIHTGNVNGAAASKTTATDAWVCGEDGSGKGQVQKTTNNGTSWATQYTDASTGTELNDIDMPTNTNGYAVGLGGTVLRTTNGTTWAAEPSHPAWATDDLNAVWAVDLNTIFIAGNNSVIRITNASTGAPTWTNITPAGWSFQGIAAKDANNLVVIGQWGNGAYSSNAGASWTQFQLPSGLNANSLAVWPATNTYWAVGERGTILKSTDGGATWNWQTAPEGGRYWGVWAISANDVVASGSDGAIIKTANGGTTWTTSVAGSPLWYGIDAVDGQNAVVVGTSGAIETTNNAGTTWTARGAITSALFDVDMAGAQVGWAVGESGGIYKTSDGGATWTPQTSGTTARLWSVFAADASTAWAVGTGGTVVHTTDGGTTWSAQNPGVAVSLMSIDGATNPTGALTLYAGGFGGKIVRSNDGGATWTQVNWPSASTVESLSVPSSTTVYSVGQWDTIYKTTTSGASWSLTTSTSNTTAAVSAVDAQTLVVSDNTWGQTTVSFDGGNTWSGISTPPSEGIYALKMVDANTMFAAGLNMYIGAALPINALPDYVLNTTDWDQGSGFFGMCLRSIGGVGTTAVWTLDGNADCTATDTDPWYAVPSVNGAGAIASRSTTSGTQNAVANFRFGVRPPASMPAGTYRMTVNFDVVAPMV